MNDFKQVKVIISWSTTAYRNVNVVCGLTLTVTDRRALTHTCAEQQQLLEEETMSVVLLQKFFHFVRIFCLRFKTNYRHLNTAAPQINNDINVKLKYKVNHAKVRRLD